MILITGSSGFVGSNLVERLNADGRDLVLVGRDGSSTGKNCYYKKEISSFENYSEVLSGCKVVIHCAARVHILKDTSSDPLKDYLEINTESTLNLAQQSFDAGIKRFIYISSVNVHGKTSLLNRPFKSVDSYFPMDFYSLSKSIAEERLIEYSKKSGLEVVIIRSPLVYGPGVKANFASLLNLVSKGLPLPFGCITGNKRSLVSIKNLVDLIETCINHPKAASQVFLVSDDHDVSTASMVKHMSHALGKSSRLLPVPLWCYRLVGKLTGKSDVVDRLIGSLQVDISHTKETLDWIPPQTLEQGFKETAEAFLLNKNK